MSLTRVGSLVLLSLGASVLAAGCGGGGGHHGFFSPPNNTPTNNTPTNNTPTNNTPNNNSGGGGGTTTGTPTPVTSTAITAIALPPGFQEPRGVAATSSGSTLFVAARQTTTGNAVILSMPAAGGSGTAIATGKPLGTPAAMTNPVALALSPDQRTLFIVDFSSVFDGNEAGAILSLPVTGGTPQVLSTGRIEGPTGISVSADGKTLFVTGFDTVDGQGALFSLPAAGGAAPTVIAKGGNLTEPTGVAVSSSGTLFVVDAGQRLASARVLQVGSNAGTTSIVSSIAGKTGVESGVVMQPDGTVRFAARSGTAGEVASVGASGGESPALVGGPLVAPGAMASDGQGGLLIADADATGPGQILHTK